MSKAPTSIVEQAQSLVAAPRLPPADDIVQDLAAWTDNRYRHGRWGWTGQDPAPPPGHAPPRPA